MPGQGASGPLRLLTKSAASENQEQARLCRTVKRLIFVPFRPAALPPLAAQNPRSGVCHHSEGASGPLRVQGQHSCQKTTEPGFLPAPFRSTRKIRVISLRCNRRRPHRRRPYWTGRPGGRTLRRKARPELLPGRLPRPEPACTTVRPGNGKPWRVRRCRS